MNKLSYLFVLGVVSALIVGGLTGYTLMKQGSYEEEKSTLDAQIIKFKIEAAQYETNNVEQALSAKTMLDGIKADYVKWSEVVERILATAPKREDTRAPIIEFSSYSGSTDNRLSLSASTVAGSKAPFSDAAELIRAFEASSYFSDPFIPSISTSGTGDDPMLVFNFQVNFNAKVVQEDLSGAVKVPVSAD